MLGSASGDFWMQPGAALQSTGISADETFLKRFFDKYGIHADYQQRYEYKNAVNPYLYSDFTPAHRESELGWMTSVYTSELGAAAADRKLNPATLRATLEAGPYSAEDAKARNLIDHVGQVSDAEAAIKAQTNNAELVDFASYKASASSSTGRGSSSIAVIGAEGDIVTGTSGNGGLNGQSGVYSDDIAKAFQSAIEDKDVKAIVFRVSSPGGSDTASEQILAGVRAAKAAGKPVVVSMGTYAASGGYWISSEASEIIAEPTTLTGSIGVFGGKFAFAEALGRFGVDQRSIGVGGDFAGAFTSGQPFTPSQRAQVSAWMDHIYEGFVARVAAGRHLPVDRVRQIAKGRVWTGEQAKQLGLVDGLGGFMDAVREAKRLSGLPVNQPVRLKTLPGKKSPFAIFQNALGVSSASIRMMAASAWLLGDPRAQGMMDEMARARLGPGSSTVRAPTPVQ
jgi:protease-4